MVATQTPTALAPPLAGAPFANVQDSLARVQALIAEQPAAPGPSADADLRDAVTSLNAASAQNVNSGGLPAELRETPHWILWRHELRKEKDKTTGKDTYKLGKVPCSPDGHHCSVTDPGAFMPFGEALPALERGGFGGLGFVFTAADPFCGVDLDHCVSPDGTLEPWAAEIVAKLASYAELSVSGTGVHIILRAMKPAGGSRRGKVEIYDAERYFCMTGHRLDSTPLDVRHAQQALDLIHAAHVAKPTPPTVPKVPPVPAAPAGALDLSDGELLTRMLRARNGAKLKRLWDGDSRDYDDDDSRGDMALADALAFWTGRDAARMDRLFRASKRMREKWDRPARAGETYGQGTIREAIASCREVYTPKAKRRKKTDTSPTLAGRPQVLVSTNEGLTVDAAIAALSSDPTLYARGRRLVSIGSDSSEGGTVARRGGLCIVTVPPANLRERLTRWGEVVKEVADTRGSFRQPTHPPEWLVPALHQRGEWPGIRPLRAVANHPVLVEGGRILATAGYDAKTGLLVDTSLAVPVPERPTAEQVRIALVELLAIVEDFQFAEPVAVHRSAWLAALLTLFARPAIDGPCPLFLIDKNVRGAGGSLLADTIAIIALGRQFPRMAETPDGEEQRKRITSILLAGDEAMLIDNLTHPLGGSAFDALLTSTEWRDRMLGKSEMTPIIPALTVWFATGNNVQVAGDTVRRVLPVRIEATSERPETRCGFRFPDLLAAVRESREMLAGCALTLLRAYAAAGSPDQGSTPWGAFEAWSKTIRNVLVWAGLPDPVGTRTDLLTVADRDRGGLVGFFDALDAVPLLRGATFTAARVAEQAQHFPELREALEELSCVERGLAKTKLITWTLKKARGRVVGGRRLDLARSSDRGNLITCTGPAEPTEPTEHFQPMVEIESKREIGGKGSACSVGSAADTKHLDTPLPPECAGMTLVEYAAWDAEQERLGKMQADLPE